jgi:hypothetical protein
VNGTAPPTVVVGVVGTEGGEGSAGALSTTGSLAGGVGVPPEPESELVKLVGAGVEGGGVGTAGLPVPVETLSCVPVETPSCVPVETPSCVPVEVPSHVPVEVPSHVPVEVPSCVPVETPSCVPVSQVTITHQSSTIMGMVLLIELVGWMYVEV